MVENEQLSSDYCYLDWAATAPLTSAAADAMQPYLLPGAQNITFGMNANSLHTPGRNAFAAMEEARRSFAHDIGARRPAEVIFTSGATEADNAAILGISRACASKPPFTGAQAKTPVVITTSIEHDAVLEPFKTLAREGFQVLYLPPSREGSITPEQLRQQLAAYPKGSVVLVSIQAANSEIGTVQPIKELAKVAHDHDALFHTDATQALGKIPFDCHNLGIDAASFSAHKIGGPKGIGALYLRARTPFVPLLSGGGQEDGRRSTTQNVCGIAGFAASCKQAVQNLDKESARQTCLRDLLYQQLMELPGVRPVVVPPVGSTAYLPNIVTIMVEGWESETLILRLDAAGFGVSGGSACASHSLEASHVLRALNIDSDLALGELRISFGTLTSEEDLQRFVQALKELLTS